jgi:hypothetical protein
LDPLKTSNGWNSPASQATHVLFVVLVPSATADPAGHSLVHGSHVAGVQLHPSLAMHQPAVTLVRHSGELSDVLFTTLPLPQPSPNAYCVVISLPLSHVTVSEL